MLRRAAVTRKFRLVSEFEPTGDQPQAIEKLVRGAKKGAVQTLLGVTGSGKTFTVANLIERTGKNTLVISHNKTLAAQLYEELKQFFPGNNVGYFVSYYDYYQPESYIPQTDTYIEKDIKINETIERMRLEATAMLMSGEPTIIVATVSCIYSLGNPDDWNAMAVTFEAGASPGRSKVLRRLVEAMYERNDTAPQPGRFRAKGDTIDVVPAYSDDVVRIQMFGDEVESISVLDHVTMEEKRSVGRITVFPAKHYIVEESVRRRAIKSIREELEGRLPELELLEQQRLRERTRYDLEMIEELGYCSGVENYSRHFDGRKPGQKAFCLLDFFGPDCLLVIDESHVTLPQLHAMYKGDKSRKDSLVTHGFRLPSAYDNRPLKYEEFEQYIRNAVFTSATPGDYEKKMSASIVEQLVRPTGLLDPSVEVRPSGGQMDDLISEIRKRAGDGQRTLVTTLTKRMAEDLAEYLSLKGVRVRYMHAEIDGLQRTEIIRQLRLGEFDVLVGINLLREGLDIPEVSLVAVLDADKEGFLRNNTSLIQTFGRAARNSDGAVIMYADSVTGSMRSAMDETDRRRKRQAEYNRLHGIRPRTIAKPVPEARGQADDVKNMTRHDLQESADRLRESMREYSEQMDFERAIECRDRLSRIERQMREKSR